MVLFVQKNSNGTYCLAEANSHKDDLCTADYYEVEELPHGITYAEVVAKAKQHGCKKLVLDF